MVTINAMAWIGRQLISFRSRFQMDRPFERLVVEVIAKAVCDRLELKEESHELPRT